MTITIEQYTDLWNARHRFGQDGADRIHDAVVTLMEIPAVRFDKRAGEWRDVEPVGFGISLARGHFRNDYRRTLKVQTILDAPKAGDGEGRTMADTLASGDAKTARDTIARALRALRPGERQIVRLMLHGYTQAEIADRLRLKHGTFRKRLHALRARVGTTE